MTEKELRSYRLNSMEEPTDEMLEAIMEILMAKFLSNMSLTFQNWQNY